MSEHLSLRISQIIPQTHEAATFVLENTAGAAVAYKAGQFLTFLFDRQGREVRRSFSLSSAPGIDPNLAVTVKRVENGEFSRYMLAHLKVGDVLTALPPAGRFTLEALPGGLPGDDTSFPGEILLLAAGSGIVPVFSILKVLLNKHPGVPVTLLYSNRSERSVIFREDVGKLAAAYPERFRCIHILSRPAGDLPRVIHGHLNNYLLEVLVKANLRSAIGDARVFMCGPFTYMRMASITLRVMGFREEQLRKENFVVGAPVPPRFRFPPGPYPKEVLLHRGGTVSRLSVQSGQSILDAALKAGIELPYSCRAGVCSTCTAQCTRGEVKMSVNEVLTDADVEQGLVLTCVGYPATPEVEVRIT